MTAHQFPLAVAVTVATALSIALLVAADGAGWIQHGLSRPGEAILAWGAAFVLGWTLMMASMSLPSMSPFLRAVERVGGGAAAATAAAGVAAVWIISGVLFSLLLWLAGGALETLPPGGAERLAALTLLAAAAYQVSPLAQGCQRLCAQPYALLARRWRGAEGWRSGAISAGVAYGASCLGCCAPMMAVMVLVGMSDLRWIFGLGLLMIVQKHPVWGQRLAWPAATVLGSAGIAIEMGWWTPELASLRALCSA